MLHRVFIAVPCTEIFKTELEVFFRRLPSKSPGIKWVKSDQTHLTLHFFASLPDEEVEKLKQVILEVTRGFSSFRLSLKGTGGFPDLRRPRILWIGVQGQADPLIALQSVLGKQLQHAGFEVEKRSFHPHLTVGRIKGERIPAIPDLPNIETPEKIIDHLELIESHLQPEGPFYEVLERFPFSPSPHPSPLRQRRIRPSAEGRGEGEGMA